MSVQGTRGVGAVSVRRTVDEVRRFSDELIGITNADSYRKAAIVAVQTGGMQVYIPVGDMDADALDAFCSHEAVLQSFGNTKGEPVYPLLGAANASHNEDGTLHGGYAVVDVIERVVIWLVNRDGSIRPDTKLVRFATSEKVVIR